MYWPTFSLSYASGLYSSQGPQPWHDRPGSIENSTLSRALLPLYLSAGPSPQLFLPSFCRRWFFICCKEVFWLSHLTFNNSFITLSFSLSFPNAMIAPDTAIWFYFFSKRLYFPCISQMTQTLYSPVHWLLLVLHLSSPMLEILQLHSYLCWRLLMFHLPPVMRTASKSLIQLQSPILEATFSYLTSARFCLSLGENLYCGLSICRDIFYFNLSFGYLWDEIPRILYSKRATLRQCPKSL